KTSGKRRVKKKVTLSANDNIIPDDPDADLELAKSISQTRVEEAEAARKVYATHARTVTESIPEFVERIFKKKAKNDQNKHGMEKSISIRSQSQSKSKVSHMKKIQLEGLKLPNLKLYCKRKDKGRNCKTGRSLL
ncbi:hypothetical protein Tco_1474961, partial [Tanacetum coccineum]